MVGAYGMLRFIYTLKPIGLDQLDFIKMTTTLEQLEERGVLMKRHPDDLGSWHVNELWYEAYRDRKKFTGWNKSIIDWIY